MCDDKKFLLNIDFEVKELASKLSDLKVAAYIIPMNYGLGISTDKDDFLTPYLDRDLIPIWEALTRPIEDCIPLINLKGEGLLNKIYKARLKRGY